MDPATAQEAKEFCSVTASPKHAFFENWCLNILKISGLDSLPLPNTGNPMKLLEIKILIIKINILYYVLYFLLFFIKVF